MTPARWKAVNAVGLVVVIALNGLAATGAMSGQSIGALANQYRSLFLPANYVFGIWSLIYAGLLGSLVWQLWPGASSRRAVERLGIWWTVEGTLNVAWITVFSFAWFGTALLVMLVFLASLILVGERVRQPAADGTPPSWGDRLFVTWPQDLYLAWISVAVIANTFQYAHVIGFGGFGIPEATWAVGMMGVATLLGVLMAYAKGNWSFPFVVAWALYGIGDRYADLPTIGSAVDWLVPGGIGLGLVAWGAGTWTRRPKRAVAA